MSTTNSEINVRVTGDTSGLSSAMQTGAKTTATGGAEMRESMSRMATDVTAIVQRMEASVSATVQQMAGAVQQAALQSRRGMDELGASTAGMSSSAFAAAGAVAAAMYAVKSATTAIVESRIQTDKWATALSFINGGSVRGAADDMAFAREQAQRLGLSLPVAIDGFTKMAAAAQGTTMAGQPLRSLFVGVAEATTTLSLSAEETQRIMIALNQILSKGTVSSEELKGQIGESLPGAFQIAARAMGVTTDKLTKMLEQGQVVSSDFLPKFGAELHRTFGDTAAQASDKMQQSVNRAGNAWTDFKAAFADSGWADRAQRLIDTVANSLDKLTEVERTYQAALARRAQFSADDRRSNTLRTISTLEQEIATWQKEGGNNAARQISYLEKRLALKREELAAMGTGSGGAGETPPDGWTGTGKRGFNENADFTRAADERRKASMKANQDFLKKYLSDEKKLAQEIADYREQFAGKISESDLKAGEAMIRAKAASKGSEGKTGQFELELAQLKQAIQQKSAAEGQYREMTLAEELAFWERKKAIHGLKSADELAVTRKIADTKSQIDREQFAAQIAAARADIDEYRNSLAQKLVAQRAFADRMLAAYGAQSREYLAAVRETAATERAIADQARQIATIQAQSASNAKLAEIDGEQAAMRQLQQYNRVTQQQLLAAEIGFELRRNEIKQAALAERLRIAQADPDRNPVEVARIQAEIEAQTRAHNATLAQMNQQVALESDGTMKTIFSGAQSGFQNLMQQIVSGTASTADMLSSLWNTLTGVFASVATQIATKWAMTELGMTTATEGAQAARAAAAAAGSTAAVAAKATEATAVVGANAVEAGSGAAASQASIPIIGPGLALAAMGATIAAVMALRGSIASASGGFDIPPGVNPLTQLHEEEMVLPAHLANPMRDLIAGGGSAGGATNITIQALDGASVERVLRANPAAVAAGLRSAARGGHL